MDQIDLSTFLHTGTLALGVAVVIITSFIRRILETYIPTIRQKSDEDSPGATYGNRWARFYNKVGVYYLPVLIGVLIGLLVDSDFLFGSIDTRDGRVFFAMVVAWFSRDVYKFVRGVINRGEDQGPDSRLPEPPVG